MTEGFHNRTGRYWIVCLAGLGILTAGIAASTPAYALNGEGHRQVTKKAIDLLKDVDSACHSSFQGYTGRCSDLPAAGNRQYTNAALLTLYYGLPADVKLIAEAAAVDDYSDLEFVDVEGTLIDGGRDNPHDDEWDAIDDEAHYTEDDHNLTAFNHFIDIKKGPGIFDDYDGYAYHKGSASRDQFQSASSAASGTLARLMARITGYKVDEGLMWWFNDEYVHAPGQSWYRGCSPSVERYSFPGDKGRYGSVRDEALARFPLADSIGRSGKGIPYSVFMPVDNMARYWYRRFESTKDPATLGPVMHAIQDASVPHHAAGYNGNYHDRYETDLGVRIPVWVLDAGFANEVKALVMAWSRNDPSPPTTLAVGDYTKTPALNWRPDMLVTWMALNAYKEYAGTYNQFRGGYSFNASSARELTKKATALSTLVLLKATGYTPPAATGGGGGGQAGLLPMDCISFDWTKAQVQQIGGDWRIVAGSVMLKDFGPNEANARRALEIIRFYRMNSQCFVGRPNPGMEYYLVDGAAPQGAFAGEDASSFDPNRVEAKLVGGSWKVVDGGHWLLDFGTNETQARTAAALIKKYAFTTICYVGRPNAPLMYFRK